MHSAHAAERVLLLKQQLAATRQELSQVARRREAAVAKGCQAGETSPELGRLIRHVAYPRVARRKLLGPTPRQLQTRGGIFGDWQ